MNNSILGLIKFGEERHIKSLQHGLMYMNPLNYFEKIEDKMVVGDEDEGLGLYLQPDNVIVKIDDFIVDNKDFAGPIAVRKNREQKVNIFCMYSILIDDVIHNKFEFKLDDRVKKFGDSCLIIINGKEFINRINKAIENIYQKSGKKIYPHKKGSGLVKYVEHNSYHGKMGVFKKFDKYEYQNEFRIALEVPRELRGNNGEFKLEIGDISDITKICNTNELKEKINIKYNDN